jgi:hypothetical protein
MRHLGLLAAAGCILVASSGSARAGDDKASRALVVKAIKAHGGEANLRKGKAMQVQASGTLDFMNNLKFTIDIAHQDPDKFKHVVQIKIDNKDLTVTQVFNGKKLWINVLNKTTELGDAQLVAELKENMYLERLSGLEPLLEKGIELSPLGEAKVNGQDAVGVRATSKGHRDLNLYFDKKSGLLVKTEARVFDLNTKQEMTQEKIYHDYKDNDGLKVAQRLTINADGKQYMTVEITSVTFLDRHEDSVFAKPE